MMAQGIPELIKALDKIDPRQPYGTELFNALAKLTVSVALEAVYLRQKVLSSTEVDGTFSDVEVYMIQRAANDTAYPGEWHCPGSAMQPGEDFEDVLARLEKREFGAKVRSHQFVANLNPSKADQEVRGTFLSVVYLCELKEKKGLRGEWFPVFPVSGLPMNTVNGHRARVIPCALGAFLAANSKF